MLALEQGRNGDVQLYAARLRLLAPSDPRAMELAAALARPAAPGQTVTAAPAPAALAPARPVMSVQAAPPVPVAPVAVAAVAQDAAPVPAVAASQSPRTELALVMASADSDDPTPAKPASPAAPKPARSAPALALGEPPRFRQVAALPQATISDGDPSIPAGTRGGARRGIGRSRLYRRTVQVAQVELQPPPVINGYQRPTVSAYSPDDTLAMQIDRNLEFLEGQSNPTLIAGLGFRGHSGDDGFDRLNEFGGSIEGSFSPWYTGTARLAVMPVWLDAGTVSSSRLSQFGANPILSAAGLGLVGSGDQTASGVGILGSYSYSDFSGQFGTSPIGFPVVNLIGNVAYTPKFLDNTLSVRIEGLREPVTNSVLSYAGTHASLGAANGLTGGAFGSNSTWGGVVKTGGRVTVFYDDQMYGAYGGAGLASLTGQSVTQNDQIDALLGTYFRPWKTDDWAIRVGVSAYYTGYNRNLAGFTFGQGGYFSPQNYIAVTFPVEYTGHADKWSWLAAAAVGVQHFNTDFEPDLPQ